MTVRDEDILSSEPMVKCRRAIDESIRSALGGQIDTASLCMGDREAIMFMGDRQAIFAYNIGMDSRMGPERRLCVKSVVIGATELNTKVSLTNTLQESTDMVVVEFVEDKKVDVNAAGQSYIKSMTQKAIERKEDEVARVVDRIHGRHDMDKVDQIFLARIFPANMDEAVPKRPYDTKAYLE